jgi:hypothetical protein
MLKEESTLKAPENTANSRIFGHKRNEVKGDRRYFHNDS